MSTVGPETDDSTDGAALPGDSSEWDGEWLPEWVNVDYPASEQVDPEFDEQLAADLEAVERLVGSLLTESSAAFEASVGAWEPEEPQPEEPPAQPDTDLSSVGFSLGVARSGPERVPQTPTPAPAVISPPARRPRRRGWLVAPLVLLLVGAVIGSFLWAGSSRRPTPAAAVHTGLSTSSALPTWTRPTDSASTDPAPVTTTPSTTPAPVPSIQPVRRPAVRTVPRTSAPPTAPSPAVLAPTSAAPAPSSTDADNGGDSTVTSGDPSCTSAANTDSAPTQTTESTTTSTETTATETTSTETTTGTETSTQTSTTTETTNQTLASQPSLGAAVSCSG